MSLDGGADDARGVEQKGEPRPAEPQLGEVQLGEVQGTGEDLVVVGIGASAGGLAALRKVFASTPKNGNIAYVVCLSPDHESYLADLLQTHGELPVLQVTDDVKLEPKHVYVIPPGRNLDTLDSHLRLSPLEAERRDRAPIDHFFRTLANRYRERAVAVILSGTGSDGAVGLSEVKEYGGLAVAQRPDEAEHAGMPESAVATGLVDLVLPLTDIPGKILSYARSRPQLDIPPDGEEPLRGERELLHKLLTQVHAGSGCDFSGYKPSAVLRRVRRRMQLHGVAELAGYLELLRRDRGEAERLFDDLLISVTSFFRDPAAFRTLETRVIPELFLDKGQGEQVRVWVAGCATGEEAYSVAMLLAEHAGGLEVPPEVQVFATDVSEGALARARGGLYPKTVAGDVSGERLRRFFAEEGSVYRVRKELRERVVFAPHNLLADPPLSKLDLVICRNVLIELRPSVQKEVFRVFHDALRGGGFLLLGTSESVDAPTLFREIDKGAHLFGRLHVPPSLPFARLGSSPGLTATVADGGGQGGYGALHARVAERYAPPSVLVNPGGDIVHLSESVGRFLQTPGGEPTNDVLRRVVPGLRVELRTALFEALETRSPATSKPVVLIDGSAGGLEVTVGVRPVREPGLEGFTLVIFDERERAEPPTGALPPDDGPVRRLEERLEAAKRQLQTVTEAYETSREEVKASNEELQSINEELVTVNQENRHKVEELSQLTGDLQNLFAATDIATLFLDRQGRIKRFTPRVAELFNVRASDRGRPLADLTHRLGQEDLSVDAEAVLRTLQPAEREVRSEAGRWFLMRGLPYRTPDDRIDGVVLTFVDITRRREAEERLREEERRYRALIEVSAQTVWTTDAAGDVVGDSPTWRAYTGQTVAARQGRGWADAVHPDDREAVLGAWDQAVAAEQPLGAEYRLWHAASGAYRWTGARAAPLRGEDGVLTGYVGMNTDVHERRYRSLFETMGEGFIVGRAVRGEDGSADFIYEDVNPAFEAVTGIARADALGQGARAVIPGLEEAWLEAADRAGFGGESVQLERYAAPLNRWYSTHFFPVGERGSGRLALVVDDVSERKRAAERLEASEERLRLAVEAGNIGTCDWNFQTGEMIWNEVRFRMYGLRPQDKVMHIDDFYAAVHPDDRERVRAEIGAGVEGRGEHAEEYRALWPDGSVRWIVESGRVVSYEDGQPLRVSSVLLDVTERREAEARVRTSEERFRALIDKGSDVITVSDRAGTVTYASPSVKAVTGYSPEAFRRRDLFAGDIHPDDLERCRAVFDDLLATPDRSVFLRHRFRHASGEWRWLEGTFTSLFHVPAVGGLVANYRDVTERVASEEALKELNETLEQRVAERTEALIESERRFSQAFHVAPVAACLTTEQEDAELEVFLDVNEAFSRLTGYSRDEAVGRSARGLGMWSSEGDQRRLAEAGLEGFHDLGLKLRTKSGEDRDILLSGERIQLGGEAGYLKMFYDVTLRRQTEEQVQRAISEVVSDTSWFSHKVMERLANIRAGSGAKASADLTKRERQVLELIASGQNNEAIAAGLGVATQTVRNYISTIYSKLAVGSRAEAIVWARERGIVGN